MANSLDEIGKSFNEKLSQVLKIVQDPENKEYQKKDVYDSLAKIVVFSTLAEDSKTTTMNNEEKTCGDECIPF